MALDEILLANFHRALVGEIRRTRPGYLKSAFPVADIYEDLVPYRTHRNVIGVAMNGDYEDVLLRLLGGQGDYLVLESERALREIRRELKSSNPNTSLFREFANADVRLNPESLVADDLDARTNGDADPVPVTDLAPEVETATAEAEEAEAVTAEGPTAEVPTAGADDTEAEEAEADETPTESRESPVHEPPADPQPAAAALTDAPPPTDEISTTETEDPVDPAVAEPNEEEAVAAACRWCSGTLPEREGVKFCPHCGGDIRLVPCAACGEALEVSWRYCVSCGVAVATP